MSAIRLSQPSVRPVHWKTLHRFRTVVDSVPLESDSGKVSYALLRRTLNHGFETITMPPDDERLRRELENIRQECFTPDWDGYGAKPVNETSIQYVLRFLNNLSSGISYPELAPEPTGDLTMVWRKKGYHLIVGIDVSGQIAWGGTSPKGHVYGDATFDEEIPEVLIDLLYAIEGIR